MLFLVDSGSTVNVLQKETLDPQVKIRFPKTRIKTLGGDPISLTGSVARVNVQKGIASIGTTTFLITDAKMTKFHGILGKPFLKQIKANINLHKDRLELPLYTIPFVQQVTSSFCGFCEDKESSFPNPQHELAYAMFQDTLGENVRLRSAKNQEIPANSAGYLFVYTPKAHNGKQILIEPFELRQGLLVGGVLIQPERSNVSVIPVMNVAQYPVLVQRGIHVAWGQHLKNEQYIIQIDEIEHNERQVWSKNASDARPRQSIQRPVMKESYDEEYQLQNEADEDVHHQCKRNWLHGGKWSVNHGDAGLTALQLSSRGDDVAKNDRGEAVLKKNGEVKKKDLLSLMDERELEQKFVHFQHEVQWKEFDEMKELEKYQLERLPSLANENLTDKQLKEIIQRLVETSNCPTIQTRNQLYHLLWKYRTVLAESNSAVGLCPLYQPTIPLDTEQPIFTPQYMVPFAMRNEMKKAVKEFLRMGIIRPSSSPYNSPSLMVPKKDGGFRLVVDFRRLNKHVITDPHPLPRITQIMETLGKAQIFSVLDLLHGFYNLEIDPKDIPKTAFSTFDGHWEFSRLPMGLKNSPAIFQRLMQIVFSGCLGHYAFIYIDDILIYSKSPKEHMDHLEKILACLKKSGLKIKASKCQIFRNEVDYLGYVAGQDGLKVNPRKMDAIKSFPTPQCVRDVQSFLGLANYFRTFIVAFSEKARPLYELLKKENKWKWTSSESNSFEIIKESLLTAPVLAFPDFTQPFLLTTDASGYAVGALLTQIQNGKERLIACNSRVLTPVEKRYSNTDRETLAVIYGIHAFRSYLWNHEFIVFTDNTAITAIANQEKSTDRRAMRWYIILSEYKFQMRHRSATTMQHADALSRNPVPKAKPSDHLYFLTSQFPENFYLSPSWQADAYSPVFDLSLWPAAMRNAKLPLQDTENFLYTREDNGLLYRIHKSDHSAFEFSPLDDKRELWVPHSLRTHVLHLAHDTPVTGHQGAKKMISALRGSVWWSGMNKDIYEYCQNCQKCQQFKHYQDRTPLTGNPIPARCLEDVSMDVVGPVPSSSRGVRYVLCIQDRLSRFLVFAPMKDATAETTARTFISSWACQFGAPKRIVTDRGTNFMSKTFAALCERMRTKHAPVTAYRPQSNAENERAHRDLHMYIAMYLNTANATNWDLLLQHAAWVHNSTVHQILKKSPFEVLTGIKPKQPFELIKGNPDLDLTLEEYFDARSDKLEELAKEAQEAIKKAQIKTQERTNPNARYQSWKEGQMVWVKKHHTKLIGQKWGNKYYGPFIIKEVISPQVLRLSLQEDPTYEDSIHVKYVRPYFPITMNNEDNKNEELENADSEPRQLRFSDLEDRPEQPSIIKEDSQNESTNNDSFRSILQPATPFRTMLSNASFWSPQDATPSTPSPIQPPDSPENQNQEIPELEESLRNLSLHEPRDKKELAQTSPLQRIRKGLTKFFNPASLPKDTRMKEARPFPRTSLMSTFRNLVSPPNEPSTSATVMDREAPAGIKHTDAAASGRNSQVSTPHSGETLSPDVTQNETMFPSQVLASDKEKSPGIETVFPSQVPTNNVETEVQVEVPAARMEFREGIPPLERLDPISSSTPGIQNKKGKIQGVRPKPVTKQAVPAAKPSKKQTLKKKDYPPPKDKNPAGLTQDPQLASSSSSNNTSDKPVTRSVLQQIRAQKEEEEKRKKDELKRQQQLAKEIRMQTLRSRDVKQ